MSYILSNNFDPTERPQTANVLSKIQANSHYKKLAPKNPSTAASSNVQTDMYSSRGFGELGSTKQNKEL